MNSFRKLAIWAIAMMVVTIGVPYLAQALNAKESVAVANTIAFVAMAIFIFATFSVTAFIGNSIAFAVVAAASNALAAVVLTVTTDLAFVAAVFLVVATAFATVTATFIVANELKLKYLYVLIMLALEAGFLYWAFRLGGVAGVVVLVVGIGAIALLAKFGEKHAFRSSVTPASIGDDA